MSTHMIYTLNLRNRMRRLQWSLDDVFKATNNLNAHDRQVIADAIDFNEDSRTLS